MLFKIRGITLGQLKRYPYDERVSARLQALGEQIAETWTRAKEEPNARRRYRLTLVAERLKAERDSIEQEAARKAAVGLPNSYYDAETSEREPEFRQNSIAKELGLTHYSRQAFLEAAEGRYPAAGDVNYHKKITKAGKEKHVAYDALLTAERSLSLAIALAPTPEVRARLERLMVEANEAAMRRVDELSRVRVTEDKVTRLVEAEGLASSSYHHAHSRRGDMHRHVHNVIHRHTRAKGSTKYQAASMDLVMQAHLDIAARANELVRECFDELGLEYRITKTGLELTCFTEQELSILSQGRQEMLVWAQQQWPDRDIQSLGDLSEREREIANEATRKSKVLFDENDLAEIYDRRLALIGSSMSKMQARLAKAIKPRSLEEVRAATAESKHTAKNAVDRAIAALTENSSSIRNRYDLLAKAAVISEYKVSSDEIAKEIDARIASKELLFRYGKESLFGKHGYLHKGLSLTTSAILRKELEIEQLFKASMSTRSQLVSDESIHAAIAAAPHKLTAGQEALVWAICGRNAHGHADQVIVANGSAGVGKTSSMKVTVAAIAEENKLRGEHERLRVVGMAPSDKAKKELIDAGIHDSVTLQSVVGDHAKFWDRVNRNTVIVLDEAGMTDLDSLHTLLSRIHDKGEDAPRLVLVGDHAQVKAAKLGDPFKHLVDIAQDHHRLVELDEMIRGQGAMRDLHYQARDASRESVLNLQKSEKHFFASTSEEERLAKIADTYLALSPEEREKFPIIVDTNTSRVAVVKAIKDRLGAATIGEIQTFEDHRIASAEMTNRAVYAIGDVIRVNKATGIFEAGENLRVVENTAGRGLVVERTNKTTGELEHVRFSAIKNGPSCSIGYAETLSLSEGELLRFTSRAKASVVAGKGRPMEIKNGERARVVGFDVEKKKLVLDLVDRDNKLVELSTDRELPLQSAIAGTVHAVQGGTFDRGLYYATSTQKNSWYVALTRFRKEVFVVSDAATKGRAEELLARVSSAAIKDRALAQDTPVSTKEPFTLWAAGGPVGKDGEWRCVLIDREDLENTQAVAAKLKEFKERFGDVVIEPRGPESKRFAEALAKAAIESGVEVRFKGSAQQVMDAMRADNERTQKAFDVVGPTSLSASSAGNWMRVR